MRDQFNGLALDGVVHIFQRAVPFLIGGHKGTVGVPFISDGALGQIVNGQVVGSTSSIGNRIDLCLCTRKCFNGYLVCCGATHGRGYCYGRSVRRGFADGRFKHRIHGRIG